MTPLPLVKSHAFGNDFVLVREADVATVADRPALARAICDRHRGIGADGLMIYTPTGAGAAMRLLNADGSRSEVSGNGVRCLGAWIAHERGLVPGADGVIEIGTEAGVKRLELLDRAGHRFTFRAAMGHPEQIALERIDVHGASIEVVTLRVGNPQCVVLGDVTAERLRVLGARLAVHARFPEGTNVELAHVEAPDRVRILIWERGVGPTEASGTGACAAAVAAIRYGGAGRDVQVVSPGGAQRVEWTDEGIFLSGWAELIAEAAWLPPR
ncbi:MAG: diaminopimelate epimerase [Acidobacteriota bacterium]